MTGLCHTASPSTQHKKPSWWQQGNVSSPQLPGGLIGSLLQRVPLGSLGAEPEEWFMHPQGSVTGHFTTPLCFGRKDCSHGSVWSNAQQQQ